MSITERIRAMLRPTMYHISVTPEAYPMVDGMTARSLYATQANLHAVVSFLSSSIAQLPLKVYTRKGETDRERDRKSVAAKLLWQPNADQTAYELIEGLTTELFLMGMAVLWVIPDAVSASGYQLRIIPQEWIMEQKGGTSYAPDAIRVSTVGNGAVIEIPKEEFVMFRMYNPTSSGQRYGEAPGDSTHTSQGQKTFSHGTTDSGRSLSRPSGKHGGRAERTRERCLCWKTEWRSSRISSTRKRRSTRRRSNCPVKM